MNDTVIINTDNNVKPELTIKANLEERGLSGALTVDTGSAFRHDTFYGSITITERPKMMLNPNIDETISMVTNIVKNGGRCPYNFLMEGIEDDHCPCSEFIGNGKCGYGLFVERKGVKEYE